MFYPADRQQLADQVAELLAQAAAGRAPGATGERPDPDRLRAVIAPHAGYVYSGSTAALAYREIEAAASRIRRVVLLGPSHYVGFDGAALPDAREFETPLGPVPLDADLIAALTESREARHDLLVLPEAHAREHSLEVHLPFLQTVLPEFTLLPLSVGRMPSAALAHLVSHVLGAPDTLLVVSSDLSHYHPHKTAVALDTATVARITSTEGDIRPEHACGAYPVSGLIALAREAGWTPRVLGRCTSADTAGDALRVVGYTSITWEDS